MSELFYINSKYVKELKPVDFDNLKPFKLKDKKDTIVMFYSDQCIHCRHSVKFFKEFAKLASFIQTSAFNWTHYSDHSEKIEDENPDLVEFFPVVWKYKNGSPVKKYDGNINPRELLMFAV